MEQDSRVDILSYAAIFEEEFSIDWVLEITGKKALVVLSALEYGCEKQWLEPKGTGIFRFKDLDKLSQIRASLGPDQTRRLHTRALDILSLDLADAPEKSSRIAKHLLNIQNDVPGCRLLLEEGTDHRKACRHDDARLYYDKALADLERHTGGQADTLFLATTLQYAKIWVTSQSYQHAQSILRKAIVKAKALEDTAALPLLRLHLAHQELFFGQYTAARKQFELGRAMIEETDNPTLIRSARLFNTFLLYWKGEFSEAFSSYEAYIPAIEIPPESRFDCIAKLISGHASGLIGQITQGMGMLDSVHQHCTKSGNLALAAHASLAMGSLLGLVNRFNEAIAYYDKALDEALASQSNRPKTYVLLSLAHAYFRLKNNKKSVKYLRDYLAMRKKTRYQVVQDPFLFEIGWAMEQGEYPGVEGLSLAEELSQAEKSHNIFMQGMTDYYKAMILEAANAPPGEVIDLYKRSMDRIRCSGHKVYLALVGLSMARLMQCTGREKEALACATPLVKTLSSIDEHLIPDDFLFLAKASPSKAFLLKEILNLGQEIVNMRNTHELLGKIILTVNRITGAERGAIFLAGETPGDLHLEAAKNLTQDHILSKGFTGSMAIVERIARSEKGGIFEPMVDPESELGKWERIRSLICVPMRLKNRLIGVLYHDNRLFQSVFKESDLEILNYFAAQAAIAIDNARVYQTLETLYQKEKEEKKYYEEQYLESLAIDEIVGKSAAIKRVFSHIESVAETDTTVLITGETGVGKELVARAVHKNSLRREGPFIRVNCAALPESLIASELFGHEKGAFTGATKLRMGRFELADGGTLFLDEIGDISPYIQVRLLRVLQTHEFERVGSQKTIRSNFRLLTATNKDLKQEVKNGCFREDLFYRLNIFPIHIPALRERGEDIPMLARHFLGKSADRLNKPIHKISKEETDKLMAYGWPGNIRELENIVERGVILSRGPHLRIPKAEFQSNIPMADSAELSLEEIERRYILLVLKNTGGKINGPGGAAEILKLHPSTLRFRIKKLGIILERSPSRVSAK
ncbi:MAG: sigma 54-interacting transcriptional regulator [Desulfobacterium sp.]|nr:sigma 54-interacting transcriptional regulator [Desulfobacterium sp.]